MAVAIIITESKATTPQFLFLISSHSLIGVNHEKIFNIIPKEIAIEIAPVNAQPKVIRYCFKINSIPFKLIVNLILFYAQNPVESNEKTPKFRGKNWRFSR